MLAFLEGLSARFYDVAKTVFWYGLPIALSITILFLGHTFYSCTGGTFYDPAAHNVCLDSQRDKLWIAVSLSYYLTIIFVAVSLVAGITSVVADGIIKIVNIVRKPK